ncbi:hypothetical protein RhiirC2_791419 [Rhizophagus irregularis]|uniref:Uncharacterized protein n=1 Tax=Rhizophagus irregularis TaxID=588596 RepID=A0A2N1MJ95_9GLOM|nr:hypothetical protein RhiirC2_791419 [Rhizophagus irregularis]
MADINDNISSYENSGDNQEVIRSVSPIRSEPSIKPRNNSLLGVFYVGLRIFHKLNSSLFFSVIKPGLLCAILQIGAQYFWYTITGETDIQTYKPESENTSSDDNIPELNSIGWNLPFSPFW